MLSLSESPHQSKMQISAKNVLQMNSHVKERRWIKAILSLLGNIKEIHYLSQSECNEMCFKIEAVSILQKIIIR